MDKKALASKSLEKNVLFSTTQRTTNYLTVRVTPDILFSCVRILKERLGEKLRNRKITV